MFLTINNDVFFKGIKSMPYIMLCFSTSISTYTYTLYYTISIWYIWFMVVCLQMVPMTNKYIGSSQFDIPLGKNIYCCWVSENRYIIKPSTRLCGTVGRNMIISICGHMVINSFISNDVNTHVAAKYIAIGSDNGLSPGTSIDIHWTWTWTWK